MYQPVLAWAWPEPWDVDTPPKLEGWGEANHAINTHISNLEAIPVELYCQGEEHVYHVGQQEQIQQEH